MAIHSVDKDGKITQYKKMPVSKEMEIEIFIEKNPEFLEKDLIIIARQKETLDEKIVDLMGLDKDGNVVIIEIKKDKTPRKVIAQILDYAVWAEDLKYEDLNVICKNRSSIGYSNVNERFRELTNDIEPEDFNKKQRLYVIGEKIHPQTKKLARYLRRKGIDINCVEINFYELDGHKIADKRDIVVEDNTRIRNSLNRRTEEEHLSKGDSSVCKLYQLLKSKSLGLGSDVTSDSLQNYIKFVRHGKRFLIVKIKNDHIRLRLRVQDGFDDPKKHTHDYKGIKNMREMDFKEKEELEDIMYLIKQSYTYT